MHVFIWEDNLAFNIYHLRLTFLLCFLIRKFPEATFVLNTNIMKEIDNTLENLNLRIHFLNVQNKKNSIHLI